MAIKHLIQPHKKDLGGFFVRRFLPFAQQKTVGPWIFFDHMGPADFKAGEGINVRPHPHINLATVTYLFAGEIFHRDSLGNSLPINPGDINLMVAGKGITHSERERDAIHQQPHQLNGLQLWHALPDSDEETAPAFYHYPAADIPNLVAGGVDIRLLMGSAFGVTSPVKTFAETLYLEASMQAGDELLTPNSEQLAIYVVTGEIVVGDQVLKAFEMGIVDDNTQINVSAKENSKIVMIGGEKMPPRFIEWNFVSSRKERIEQAKEDWRQQRFPKVVDDEEEYIPLP